MLCTKALSAELARLEAQEGSTAEATEIPAFGETGNGGDTGNGGETGRGEDTGSGEDFSNVPAVDDGYASQET